MSSRPTNHSDLAAAVLKPYVSERVHWIVQHHGLFQGYYFHHHLGGDRYARERLKDHPWYDDCVHFCHNYDQNAFDPDYDTLPLEFFEPMRAPGLRQDQVPAPGGRRRRNSAENSPTDTIETISGPGRGQAETEAAYPSGSSSDTGGRT